MRISVDQLTKAIGGDPLVMGDFEVVIDKVTTPSQADRSSLIWFRVQPSLGAFEALLNSSPAAVFLFPLPAPASIEVPRGKCLVFTPDPRLSALMVMNRFFRKRPDWGRHPTAVIHPEADISPETYIGPNCIIGKCRIEKGSILYGNNYIHDGVLLGQDVIVHPGAVIGSDGFGYQPDEQQQWLKFEHIGGVEIGKGVEIGANTCIDRGTLGNTVIGDGTKIDNLVQVGHNAIVGRHCLIIAHAMLGGSCIIGDHAWISPGAGVLQKVQIGEKATLGFGTIALKNVPPGETWVGVPARKVEK